MAPPAEDQPQEGSEGTEPRRHRRAWPRAGRRHSVDPEQIIPGLGELRDALTKLIAPRKRGADVVAGLNVAIANVPDGLANGALVGVNPVYGLYATMLGPFVGGLLSSTRLMIVTTTAAASLTASQALGTESPEERASALFLMVFLSGLIQLGLGFAGLGRVTHFVSYSVTTGFLTGVAVLLVLSQLPTLAGVDAEGPNRVAQTLDLLGRLDEAQLDALGAGLLALVLAKYLPRTRLKGTGRLIAIALPSLGVVLLDRPLALVHDVGVIPRSVPLPSLPPLSAAFDAITGAISVAVVVLVQGAGISQTIPNPGGQQSRPSRDFMAQGAANVASGLFSGLPVGGSVSATALNVLAGARSRRAGVLAGVWMVAIVLVAPVAVGYIAMPALSALLVLAGLGSLKPDEIESVWDSGWPARLAVVTTFTCTLLLPIQAAVGIGVVLAALLFLLESREVRVLRLVRHPDGVVEVEPPRTLPDEEVVVLQVYGDLHYAGARALEEEFPSPRGSRRPVVVLRLRGLATVGATLLDVLATYAEALDRSGGRLILSGMGSEAHDQLATSDKLQERRNVQLFEATPVLGESTRAAGDAGRAWLTESRTRDAREARG